MSATQNRKVYWLAAGTVRPMIRCDDPFFCHHFGWGKIHVSDPVISDYDRKVSTPVIEALNAGVITQEEAIQLLEDAYRLKL